MTSRSSAILISLTALLAASDCRPHANPDATNGGATSPNGAPGYILLLREAPVLTAPAATASRQGFCAQGSLLRVSEKIASRRTTGGFDIFCKVACHDYLGFIRYGRHTDVGSDRERLARESDRSLMLYDFGVRFSGIYHAGDFEFVLEPKLLTDPDGIPRAVIGRGGIGMTHALRQVSQEQYELSTAPADLRWFEAEGIDADTRITVEALPAGTVRFTGTSQYSLYQRILEIGAFERDPDPAYPDVIE